MGRVSVEKDHALLVRAAGPLLGPRVRLVIVGDGAELPRVREAAEAYSPWVVFTGVRHDVSRVLASLDAFVLSSRSEGLPLALLEAMACGLPTVSTRVGGVAEVVDHGSAGMLVPARDEGALREAMTTLMADSASTRSLGNRARERARHYDARHVVDRYNEVYEGALGSRGAAPSTM